MGYISRRSRRVIGSFLLVFCLGAAASRLRNALLFPRVSDAVFGCLVIAWALTLQRRIIMTGVRRCLLAVSGLMFLLFLLRMSRDIFFVNLRVLPRYLWYADYIPYLLIPLLSAFAAYRIGGRGDARFDRFLRCFCVFSAFLDLFLIVVILLNDAHQKMFVFYNGFRNWYNEYRGGVLYGPVMLWIILTEVFSLLVILERCRLVQCRKFSWIPMLPVGMIFVLAMRSPLAGGFLRVGGRKLFHMQELFCFTFAVMWESCIQIGLVPSNSGYGELFDIAGIRAVIRGKDGRAVLRSQAAALHDDEEKEGAGAGERLQRRRIRGGTVSWIDDISNIARINEQLMESGQRLAEENVLAEAENRLKEQRLRNETQARILGEIERVTQSRRDRIETLFSAPAESGEAFRGQLKAAMILGTYVKRRANLQLLPRDDGRLSTQELYYALRESMESLALTGAVCDVRADGEQMESAGDILLCYEFFEQVIERYMFCLSAAFAVLGGDDGLSLRLELGLREYERGEPPEELLCCGVPGGIVLAGREEDTLYVRLRLPHRAVQEGGGICVS
ncbi:cell division protein ZapB [Lachnoclostridium sp. Marseille-P6806]|uniref:cell division protein ZapB n=1 Tax=Lachnoclostridium sp. Marseille-P6806 TaxID=2364793 RepID=UPI001031AF9A|nr:cell division protein ZapB [Lachnoclostridium sp. Marseille-P6806]